MAYSAARAVADAPGTGYNPLFLYSGVGLGKTHLLHAIGHAVHPSGLSVMYVTSEQFTNDFITSIANRTTEAFRDRYRSVNVLLMDDVQFLSGKEQTHESFFHTFNDLHNSGNQVVITSDRAPKALALLQDRMRSRLEWGLTADIQPPDFETRMAILVSKAKNLGVRLGENVIELIAKRIQKNVRELEGSLNRMVGPFPVDERSHNHGVCIPYPGRGDDGQEPGLNRTHKDTGGGVHPFPGGDFVPCCAGPDPENRLGPPSRNVPPHP